MLFLSGGKRRHGQRNSRAKLALEEAYARWYINKEFERHLLLYRFLVGFNAAPR
jgi:hypothetical protein